MARVHELQAPCFRSVTTSPPPLRGSATHLGDAPATRRGWAERGLCRLSGELVAPQEVPEVPGRRFSGPAMCSPRPPFNDVHPRVAGIFGRECRSMLAQRRRKLASLEDRMRRTLVISGLAPVVVLATILLPSRAMAAPPPASDGSGQASDDTSSSKSAATDDRPGGRRRISLDDDFLVEGKLDKPSAFYILRRSTMDYDWARLDAQFSPLVLESVQDPLF